MDYWADVMQDDVYLIAADGWLEAAKPRGVIDDREKKIKETPDLVVKKKKYKMDLIPPPLIVAGYFADEQAEIDELQAKQDEATQALEDEPDCEDEEAALNRSLEMMDAESEAKKAVKDAQEKLDAKVLKKYGDLTDAEIKTLAVDDKWFVSIQEAIGGEVQRITQRLAERVKELEERYASPVPELMQRVDTLSARVDEHFKRMGFA